MTLSTIKPADDTTYKKQQTHRLQMDVANRRSWSDTSLTMADRSWSITTTQIDSALHPSGVAKLSTSFYMGKCGKVTAARWQITLCDLIWHVISRSGEVIFTNCYIQLNYGSYVYASFVRIKYEFLDLLGARLKDDWLKYIAFTVLPYLLYFSGCYLNYLSLADFGV